MLNRISKKNTIMEDYYRDKKQKQNDFLKGLLINFIVGVIVVAIYWAVFGILELAGAGGKTAGRIISWITIGVLVVLVIIYEFRHIRKHMKTRRYIAIGMLVALVLPLLAFGACSPMFIYVTG